MKCDSVKGMGRVVEEGDAEQGKQVQDVRGGLWADCARCVGPLAGKLGSATADVLCLS
jgi:hypothetical protein